MEEMLMPPKPDMSREQVLQAAFDLLREKGIEALTARSLAERLHCSTQPIYRIFKSMDELKEQAYERAACYLMEEAVKEPSYTATVISQAGDGNTAVEGSRIAGEHEKLPESPALRFAIRFLELATTEKPLFHSVFFSGVRTVKLEEEPFIGEEIAKALMSHSKRLRHADERVLNDIYLKLTMYLIGMASLMNSGTLRLEMADAIRMIHEMYEILLKNLMTAQAVNTKE
jgi:AcrR family transcriptional regulator